MPGTNPFGGSRPTPLPSVVVGVDADPFIGMHIGDFRIDGFVAQGGMGRVYTATNRTVGNLRQAVKVLLNPTLENDRERFLKEAHAASTARSGNIVSITNFGFLPGGQPFLMMELLEGRTLERYLEERRRLPYREALGLAQQVLAALKVIHDEAKLVHRDLKPANLFLVNDRTHGMVVKVMDLGMAAARPRVMLETGIGTHLEADRGGTPAYASPEQFGNYAVGTASDVYSLGVVLYEMVTGQLPFPEVPGESDTQLARRHVHERPRDPQLLNPDLPEDVADLILQMLAKEAPARPTVGAAYNTVARLLERHKDRHAEGPTHVGPAPGPPSPSRAHLPTDRLPALEHRRTERALARTPEARQPSSLGWVAALVLLFGVGALGALWWLRPGEVAVTPTPAPAPVVVAPPAPVPAPAPAAASAATPAVEPAPAPVEPVKAAPRRPAPAEPPESVVATVQRVPPPAKVTAPAPRPEPRTKVVVEAVSRPCTFDLQYLTYARGRVGELRREAAAASVDPDGPRFSALEDELGTALKEKDCRRANLALSELYRLVGVSDE